VVRVAGPDLRTAGLEDAAETAQTLTRAFHDDPVFNWIFPAASSRDRRLRRYFLTELHHESLRHGAVDVAILEGRIERPIAFGAC
jgi:hypothetical protein